MVDQKSATLLATAFLLSFPTSLWCAYFFVSPRTASTRDMLIQIFVPPTITLRRPVLSQRGGVNIEDPESIPAISERLRSALKNSGPIPCRFRRQVSSPRDDNGDVVWNQSCVAPLYPISAEFEDAVRFTMEAFSLPERNILYSPPLGEPHYSFAYGNQPEICKDLLPPPDFNAHEAVLYQTHPASLEGVPRWHEISRIQLC
mmetsp:Transcript_13113/g.26168  ORF Transcript_13113/g.26168 Transcript_13113/m.26168 type:complete len:202 (-) Transcript_13113:4-609(-)